MALSRRKLSVFDRSVIEVRLRDGWGIRAIARGLDRSPGMVSDEVRRHGGAGAYQAQVAAAQAEADQLLTGRRAILAYDGDLFARVAGLLRLGWSPEQVSGRRQRMQAGLERPSGLSVSREAIYTAIYALPRGEPRREPISCLRQGKPTRGRKPKGAERRGKLCNMANIKERPGEIEGRLVPGHWEGDIVLGAGGASAIGTLVERTTRFVVLVRMPTRKADVMASAFAGALGAIPPTLRKTLTYGQGKEMAQHRSLALSTGMRIFFADPHAPWQRGSNENTNGLLRQYFPKGISLSGFDQDDLDTVAGSLNDRPRKTHDFETPRERFNKLLAEMAATNKTTGEGVRSGT